MMVETLKRKADGEGKSSPDGAKTVRARRASKPKVKTGCNNCKYVDGRTWIRRGIVK